MIGLLLTYYQNRSGLIDLFQNRSGHFSLLLPSGKQVVEVKGEGFSPVTKLITVVPGGAEMYANGEFRDVLFYRDDIEANLEREYRPGQ